MTCPKCGQPTNHDSDVEDICVDEDGESCRGRQIDVLRAALTASALEVERLREQLSGIVKWCANEDAWDGFHAPDVIEHVAGMAALAATKGE